jgi:c-di-GMP-related signal transduction protein
VELGPFRSHPAQEKRKVSGFNFDPVSMKSSKATKRVYQIIDKRTEKPVKLSYAGKLTWINFPTQAIQNNSYKLDSENYYVQELLTVEGKKYDLSGNVITK